MASVVQPYSPHPSGLQQHPGMAAGHPMAGHPQQGVQPSPGMPQQGFQMGVGVSGPGVPQVSQTSAMMGGGMPPGISGPGGQNAIALQHLNPAMYQQQQQQMACTYISRFLSSHFSYVVLAANHASQLPIRNICSIWRSNNYCSSSPGRGSSSSRWRKWLRTSSSSITMACR